VPQIGRNMQKKNYLSNTIKLLRLDKKDVYTIYLYAIAGGLISLGLPLGIQAIIGFVMASQLSTSLILLIIVVVLATFLYGFFQISQLKLIEKIKQKIFVRFSLAFDEKLSKLDYQKNRTYNLAELMNRFFDTLTFQKSMSKLLIDIPTSTIQILLGLILLAFYHPLFILFGIFLLLTLYFLLRYTGVQGMKTSVQESTHKYELAYWLEEQADNIKDVHSGNFVAMKTRKTNSILSNYISARTDHFKILNIQYWSLTLFKVVLTGVMLIVGTYLLLEQLINIGQFVAAEIVIILILSAIEKMIFGLDNAYDLLTSTKKLFDVFDLPENHETELLPNKPHDLNVFQADNISVFADDNKPLLENISFSLQKGDICNLSGLSGSGKSTLINVLAGVYTSFQGRLTIDDIVLSKSLGLPPNQYVAAHFRDSDLLETSIVENITLGNNYPLSSILSLSKAIGFHTEISQLPDGYQTIIASHKSNIPSGVRQMVLLLRTLITPVSIFILESPFQNLTIFQSDNLVRYWKENTKDKIIIYSTNAEEYQNVGNKELRLHNGTGQFTKSK
jgi:ABC-type bacteriocin/lantibiotic exporter with double-glycine peptidase domain